jgi:hypothetical protein
LQIDGNPGGGSAVSIRVPLNASANSAADDQNRTTLNARQP